MSPTIRIALATAVAFAAASGAPAFAKSMKHPDAPAFARFSGAYASMGQPHGAITADGLDLADRQGFFYRK